MTLELNRSLAYSWQTFGEYCADCICSAISCPWAVRKPTSGETSSGKRTVGSTEYGSSEV